MIDLWQDEDRDPEPWTLEEEFADRMDAADAAVEAEHQAALRAEQNTAGER